MSEHGYVPYTRGCRCEVCKAAKASYVRNKRRIAAASRHNSDGMYVADGITHGTYAGYADAGCRCNGCAAAKSDVDKQIPSTTKRAAKHRAWTRLSKEFPERFSQLYDEELAK